MQDTTHVQSPKHLAKVFCAQCGTSALIPSDGCGFTRAALEAAGWADFGDLGFRCSLDFELGKETKAEAAQAYDAETLSRLWDLGSRLRRAGQLDPVAVELVEHAWAALDWVLNHPGQQVHGLPTGQLSSLQDRGEAL